MAIFKMNAYCLWCIVYCSFGAFVYGYDSGFTTSIIGYPEFVSYFGFDSTTLGAMGSVYYAGNFVGALSNSWLPDRFGRRASVQLASVISLVGCGMQTGATNLSLFLVGRAVGGVACGIIWSLCPMYASELCPPHVRGRVGGLYNVNLNLAYAAAEWMGLGFSYIDGGQVKWRVFVGLQVLFAILMLAGSFSVAESPRWLVAQARHEQALKVLERLHGSSKQQEGPGSPSGTEDSFDDDDNGHFYIREFNQIKAQICLEQEVPQMGIVAIMKRPSYRKRLYLVIFFFVFQQLTAIIPLQNYQVLLYNSLGITVKLPLILVGVWGTVALLIGIAGMCFFDRLGRRKSFFISMSGVLLGSVMLTAFWARYEASGNSNRVLGLLALWSMFMYLVGYAWILNAFGYTYTPEIMTTDIRATGMSLGFASKTAIVVMLAQVTPIAIESISWRFFMIFIFMNVIFIVVFYFFFPETANIPLEEVAAIFGDEVVVKLDEAEKHLGDVKEVEFSTEPRNKI